MSQNDEAGFIERPGVLCKEQIKQLIEKEIIVGWQADDEDIGKSSIDLHLSGHYWTLPAGFKCRHQELRKFFQSAIKQFRGIKEGTIPETGLTIKPKETYLFQIKESVNLPNKFKGHGSGKSSIGRLDVLTRLMADHEEKYDHVTSGTPKNLYVEVTPLSFPIMLFSGNPIYQLRITKGEFERIQIPNDLLAMYSVMMRDEKGDSITGDNQTCLRLNLKPIKIEGIGDIVAFKAKNYSNEIVPLILNSRENTYDPDNYWECISVKHEEVVKFNGNYALKVKQGDFYILRSKERFTLPDDIAVYGVAMTEEVGELRIHHAGFVHPGFGSKREDKKGTPLIFEVRGHDVDMFLVDGDLMANLRYYPMSKSAIDTEGKSPKQKKSSVGKRGNKAHQKEDAYEKQELKLSKIFKDFGHGNRSCKTK